MAPRKTSSTVLIIVPEARIGVFDDNGRQDYQMQKSSGRILKVSDVKVEGQTQIGLLQPGSASPKGQPGACEPTARVVKNNPEFALVEITCSCGQTMYLRCEYAGAQPAAEGPKTSTGEVGTPETVNSQAE